MGKMSMEKGKRGEREFASLCRNYGYNVTRSAQHCGKTAGVADVVGLPGIHVEVKNQERLNLRDAMNQAIRDSEAAGQDEIPIVAHKRNNAPWLITMIAEDFFHMYGEYWPILACGGRLGGGNNE